MTEEGGLGATVEASPDGVTLRVRAQPGARKNALTGVREDELCVAVTAPPDKGRANDAIAKLLAKTLGVSRGSVQLVAGPMNRHKRFAVRGVERAGVLATLQTALPDGL